MRITISKQYDIYYIVDEKWNNGRKELTLSTPGRTVVARTVLLGGRESVAQPVKIGNYYAENVKDPRDAFVTSLRLLAHLVDEETIEKLKQLEDQREYLELANTIGFAARETDII